jgi:cystathionine gamma-synthase
MGVFTEFPLNPLLTSPDLPALVATAHEAGRPVVVDDTISSFCNVTVAPPADAVVTSLTKFFSGVGDVMGGSIVLNAAGPHYTALRQALTAGDDCPLWPDDAAVLAANAADMPARVRRMNTTAATLAAHLNAHPAVADVCYPSLVSTANYDAVRRPDGGYGGVLSVVLADGTRTAPPFFDALAVNKGPSLGTNFTIACPYTILAHYDELAFAEKCGVSSHLIRVSVGLEPAAELIRRFDDALGKICG